MPTISELSGISFSSFKFVDGIDVGNIASIDGVSLVVETLLLDTSYGSGAAVAYSVRKLRTAYKGAAIQVQATAGGGTAEIGFDVDNNLDTTTLLNFAGTNEVRVSIWYDQSTNGNNAVQTTVAQRPIVVAAGGALVEIDGRAAMNLDGNTDGFNITSNIQGAYSIFTIGNPGGNDRYYQDSTFGSRQFIIRNSSVAGDFSKYQNGTATSYLYDFRKELVEFISNAPTITYTNTLLMRYTNSGAYLGDFSEYIIYTSDKSGTDQTSIQENIGDYFTQNQAPYLLDTYTGAAASYSLRKLRDDYTGFAITVQDSVGGATQDIGFDVFGELNTVRLSAYGSNNDVFVTTWFDQSGSGNNATQTSFANRPKIYDGASRTVILENGKPAIQLDGSNDFFNISITVAASNYGVFYVMRREAADGWLFDSLSGRLVIDAANIALFYDGGFKGTAINPTQQSLISLSLVSPSSAGVYINGTSSQSGISYYKKSIGGTTRISSSASAYSFHVKGILQEFIIYASDESANRTGIETNINDFYNIY